MVSAEDLNVNILHYCLLHKIRFVLMTGVTYANKRHVKRAHDFFCTAVSGHCATNFSGIP